MKCSETFIGASAGGAATILAVAFTDISPITALAVGVFAGLLLSLRRSEAQSNQLREMNEKVIGWISKEKENLDQMKSLRTNITQLNITRKV